MNRWRLAGWTGALFLLLLPAVAMLFTDEMNWGAEDFAALGAMLLVAGLFFELTLRITGRKVYRIAGAFAIAAVFFLFWLKLAVGARAADSFSADTSLLKAWDSYDRDFSVVNRVAELLNQYRQVMVIYGAGHYVQQEEVLKNMLGAPVSTD